MREEATLILLLLGEINTFFLWIVSMPMHVQEEARSLARRNTGAPLTLTSETAASSSSFR